MGFNLEFFCTTNSDFDFVESKFELNFSVCKLSRDDVKYDEAYLKLANCIHIDMYSNIRVGSTPRLLENRRDLQ